MRRLPQGSRANPTNASTSVALNALYEFDWLGSPRVRTYVGAGLVYLTEVDIDFEAAGVERSFSGDDTGWQVLAGARYDFSPQLFFDVGLRYLVASGVKYDGEDGAVGRLVSDYEPLAISASIGWRFYSKSPPKGGLFRRCAPPFAAPPESYLIFVSLYDTCLRTTGSYFFTSILSGCRRLFFVTT
jgi:hypothetical protein